MTRAISFTWSTASNSGWGAYRELEPYALFPLDEYFGGMGKLSAKEITPRDAFNELFDKKAA